MNDRYSPEELKAMNPGDFRRIVRQREWTGVTLDVCGGYAQTAMILVPREYASDFLLFCNRNPRPFPVIDVTDVGDPHPKRIAPEADLRTDLPEYRVWENGKLIDEPTDITDYWRKDLVGFLTGCSAGFQWALAAADIPYRGYGAYPTNIPCIPAGAFKGPVAVTCRAFHSAHDAVRAIQITSRHLLMHGPPIYIGNPAAIGVKNLGLPDEFNPYRPVNPPPEPTEIVLSWGCGLTAETVALESKISLMITNAPAHMFVTDRLSEELAII